ncbi:uncharacterized protein LOC106673292 [Cimex lectularius]|uniref:Uncharacterized protein n=1 Tax=Cimex lectularius TaxID=79782 RepID=A0A8I6TL56_CIMLE|nr:uncharacterized protein LOC106673292 [Cimex lectularius]
MLAHPTLDPDETGASSTTTEEEIQRSPITGKKARKVFFLKVYLVITAQFLFHLAIVLTFVFIPDLREFFFDYYWLAYIFMGGLILIIIILAFSKTLRTCFPLNVFFLMLITALIGLCFGMLTAQVEVYGVVYGIAATAAITFIMTIFAVFSPFDILSRIMVFLLVFLITTILATGTSLVAYLFDIGLLQLVITTALVITASLYFFFLTKLIIGGHLAKLEENEWISAVIFLYCAAVRLLSTAVEVCFGFCRSY